MSRGDDLTPLFGRLDPGSTSTPIFTASGTGGSSGDVSLRQGVVTAFDWATHSISVDVGSTILTDISLTEGYSMRVPAVGDVVSVLVFSRTAIVLDRIDGAGAPDFESVIQFRTPISDKTAPPAIEVLGDGIRFVSAITTSPPDRARLELTSGSGNAQAAMYGDGTAIVEAAEVEIGTGGLNAEINITGSGGRLNGPWETEEDLAAGGRLTVPRIGCRLRRVANQSVNTNSVTSISWDTEDQDTDGFIAVTGTTVAIPAGLGGLYAITFRAVGTLTTAAQRGFGQIVVTSSITGLNGLDFRFDLNEVTVPITIPLADADSFVCQVFHNQGSAVNFTAWPSCYRIGD